MTETNAGKENVAGCKSRLFKIMVLLVLHMLTDIRNQVMHPEEEGETKRQVTEWGPTNPEGFGPTTTQTGQVRNSILMRRVRTMRMLQLYLTRATFLLALSISHINGHAVIGKRQATATQSASLTATTFQYCPESTTFVRFATFGDSYASGVTYGSGCISGNCNGREDRDYDFGNPGLIRQCRRITDAYAFQTKNDCSWTGSIPAYLDWPACSGSRLDAIGGQAGNLFSAQKAHSSANISNFATLQIGGNDAGFFDIAAQCFFQPNADCNYDYGPAYPDTSGQCWQAVQNAQSKVSSAAFQSDFTKALDAVLTNEVVKDKTNFRLFVLGYAQLFKINDVANGDGCDKTSWTAWCNDPAGESPADRARLNKYMVTTKLRQDVNDVVMYLNNVIALAVKDYAAKDSRVSYVDIDGAFQDHRFCQVPSGGSISTGWEESWFWRGPHLSDFFVDEGTEGSPMWNAQSQLDPATVATCSSLGSASTAPWDVQLACELKSQGQPVATQPIGPTSDWSGPGGGGLADRGEVLRTFHPTTDGHQAIYKFLVEAITQEQKKSPFIKAT